VIVDTVAGQREDARPLRGNPHRVGHELRGDMETLGLAVAAARWGPTRHLGLSLGDCAWLAIDMGVEGEAIR
jgi:hypothetical protein